MHWAKFVAATCKILLPRFFLGIYDMIYLLTAIGLTPGGNSTVHICTQYREQQNETKYTEHT